MQFIVISDQLRSMLWGLLLGAGLGLLYDAVRFLRRLLIPDGRGSIALANFFDILFSVAAAIAYSVFVFMTNSGRNRWYIFFSVAVGFVLYRVSAGKIVKIILFFLADKLRLVVSAAIRLLIKPFKSAAAAVIGVCAKISERRKERKRQIEKARMSKVSKVGRVRERTMK